MNQNILFCVRPVLRRWAVLFIMWALGASAARAYMVGPPQPLEKLEQEADLIFKGTAMATDAVRDDSFQALSGFQSQETRFTVVSVIKGALAGKELAFHHYDNAPPPFMFSYAPQYYHFELQQSYIVFAKKTDQPGVCRQIWNSHTGIVDQGVLHCSDDKPTGKGALKEVLWNELVHGTQSPDADSALYALQKLDQMSGGSRYPNNYSSTRDFDHVRVLEVLQKLLTHEDAKVATTAIVAAGSHNAYMEDDLSEGWLNRITGKDSGSGEDKIKLENPGGKRYWKELRDIADSKASSETRALAIRALGWVRNPELRSSVSRWLTDQEPVVRASAALLLADYPGTEAKGQWTMLDADPSPMVRMAVVHAVGFARQYELVQILGGLIGDQDPKVRRAACQSLLSFSPKNEAVARVYRANLTNKEFDPLFLNELARDHPEAYLDELARVLETQAQPENWGGGTIPAYVSWQILFTYLQAQPPDSLKSGKLDRQVAALGKLKFFSSSEPQQVYAFYLLNGMSERAKEFRTQVVKNAAYDLDAYLKKVESNPAAFKRQ